MSCRSQEYIQIQDIEDNQRTTELLWRLSPTSISVLHTESDFFYKSIKLPLSEGESNLEGEILTRFYLLKGEYGEYPEGILYKVGDFLAPQIMAFKMVDGFVVLELKHVVDRKIRLSLFSLKT